MGSPRTVACPNESCRAAVGDPCRNNQGDIVRAHDERAKAGAPGKESLIHARLRDLELRVMRLESLQFTSDTKGKP